MEGMDEIVQEFLVESQEGLDRFDQDMVSLEKDRDNRELLDAIFRAIHTIKGTAGVIGFPKLVSISHLGENILSRMRDGSLQLNDTITSALLAMADALRELLAQINQTGSEGDKVYEGVIAKLTAIVDAAEAADKPQQLPETPLPQAVPKLGSLLYDAGKVDERDLANALEKQTMGDKRRIGAILAEEGTVGAESVSEALKVQAAIQSDVSNSTIRVDVSLLDKVMNLVGELVLARNQILQFAGSHEDASFVSTAQRLNLITTELQEGVMKTRMQPIGMVWNKLPRIIRDLALSCGKQVAIEMDGADTELDKTLIEAIKDPITHIIRNAVDHGIEKPDVRAQHGKPEQGRISLRAYHEGGQVNVEICDDGQGINVDRVKQKAIERGLINAAQAVQMSSRDSLNLIFAPGLSTAEQVSNISGRGVGMDVVKTNIEKIGGAIDIQSSPSQGTTIKIKIPLTLAIIPALIVTSGGERFAIPQVSLVELVRSEGETAKKIEKVKDSFVYRLRGNLLPLVYLNQTLRVRELAETGCTNIVVLQAGIRQFGLVVDEINDTEEIVVKPLSKQLKSIGCFAGATIMGDGKVALILDVPGLAEHSQMGSSQKEAVANESTSQKSGTAEERQSWLLFRVGKQGRFAIPLSLVARLEEFQKHTVESSAGRKVVQYRGEIMPLIRVSSEFGMEDGELAETLQVIVYSEDGRNVGLLVDEILDIVEEQAVAAKIGTNAGLLGSAVIHKHVTDLMDARAVVAKVLQGTGGVA